jgi:hypothetical protein
MTSSINRRSVITGAAAVPLAAVPAAVRAEETPIAALWRERVRAAEEYARTSAALDEAEKRWGAMKGSIPTDVCAVGPQALYELRHRHGHYPATRAGIEKTSWIDMMWPHDFSEAQKKRPASSATCGRMCGVRL